MFVNKFDCVFFQLKAKGNVAKCIMNKSSLLVAGSEEKEKVSWNHSKPQTLCDKKNLSVTLIMLGTNL